MKEWVSGLLERVSHRIDDGYAAIGDVADEATRRILMAWDVLLGRMPRAIEQRSWNRAIERPILLDCKDWTTGRRIFSILVWPNLNVAEEDADEAQRELLAKIKTTVARGAAAEAWSLQFEVDHGLVWDASREAWTDSTGYFYDGRGPKAKVKRAA